MWRRKIDESKLALGGQQMRLPAMSSGTGITFSPSSGVIIAKQRGCRNFSDAVGNCTFKSKECCDFVVTCYHTRDGGEICHTEKKNCQTRSTGFSCDNDPGDF
jgi:hypothetical protein